MEYTLGLIFLVGIIALLYAGYLARKVSFYETGNQKMQEISSAIQEGALAFLHQEYKIMAWFIVIFGALIAFFLDNSLTPEVNEGVFTALAFVFGCVVSILAGYIGMRIATLGNVRTTFQAQKSLSKAFQVAFESGSVMGLGLVSFAVLGLGILYVLFGVVLGYEAATVMEIMAGFALGASSIALFARVGGGIYTKAADVGADLVGKVEKGIPEDDPRNPAVIADNVGDNVGDIAGMGADLFGSCAESTCSALVIGAVVFAAAGLGALLYPLLISVVGIVACFFTLFLIKLPEGKENVEGVLKRGLIISSLLVAVGLYFVTKAVLPAQFELLKITYTSSGVYFAVLSGIVSGLLIGIITEYYTSHHYKPVRSVANASKTGAATNIIYGIALGYESSVLPIILLAITVFVAYSFAGFYGIAVAAIGMLSTLVLGLAIDAYGPVSDNAGGIAEMAGLDKSVRKKTDVLDAAGNTTAAIGKGFAIGSAVLTGLALFSAFIVAGSAVGTVAVVNLLSPIVISGLFIGALLPFIFSALTMKSVGKAALSMVEEVRRQFKTIKGLMQGKAKPDYKKCVMISTEAALKEMILPGILVLGTPLVVGVLFGVQALAGVLMGAIVTGAVLAIASANSGGAWDNAKKYIEAGNLGGKGSDVHKAAVVGDTVGDPFKDTSGPSLNILIKLMAITSLVFVPLFVKYGGLLVG